MARDSAAAVDTVTNLCIFLFISDTSLYFCLPLHILVIFYNFPIIFSLFYYTMSTLYFLMCIFDCFISFLPAFT